MIANWTAARARAREGRPGAGAVWWALAVANARYWTSVAPVVRRELRRWRRVAEAMPAGAERELALAKLRGEAFNAEVAATLATLAPRGQRADAARAIVALEVLYDYLDGVSERVAGEPVADGERVFEVFVGAVGGGGPAGLGDDGYAGQLARAVRDGLESLPGWDAVAGVAESVARRCARAQVHIHAVPERGVGQAREWAEQEAVGTGLGWWELLAGAASSVLAVHALIAAAARSGATREEAQRIVDAYLVAGVPITVLDSLVDLEADRAAGHSGFVALYEDTADLAPRLARVAHEAGARLSELRDGAHHLMTLAGIVAYWTTEPGARHGHAVDVSAGLRRELSPGIWPTLAVLLVWRAAKRVNGRLPAPRPHGS